ncbi:MAG: glycosyltransferase family 39 protein [Pseudolabrys sp.]|nr:glycosyltransferase family 39 protein [Pseudolabrys sp.]
MRLLNPMNAAGRLRDALVDPKRANRTLLLTLAVYVLLWTAYATIAKGTQGFHFDMVEVIAWSRDMSHGYLKHPPLAAAVAWVWFAIFPVAEWSYYLLSMMMPALALWIIWHLSADYINAERRVAGLALLMLVPFFHFHAMKFNVNTVLIPLWAATTFFFLRSIKTQHWSFAVLAGIAAALCMLGKYWSIFLLAGLVVAALIDRRRMLYFKSPAPWITIVAGFAVIYPHLSWLHDNAFAPFTYAMTIHGDKAFIGTAMGALGYLAGSAGYVALPLILVLAAARPNLATLKDMAWPTETERRLAAAAFWAPFLLPPVLALMSGTQINSLWSMSAWSLLPVLLLSSPKVTWRPADTQRTILIAIALPLVMLLASPAIAILSRKDGPPSASMQGPQLAAEVERQWQTQTTNPLRFVGGDGDVALAVVAFAKDRPRVLLPDLPAPSAEYLQRSGMVLLCFSGDAQCLNAIKAKAGEAASTIIQTSLFQKSWGTALPPRSYTIIIVPPRG